MGCALSSAQPPASPGSAARRAVVAQQQPLRRGPGDPSNRTVTSTAPWAEPTPLTQQQLQMKREHAEYAPQLRRARAAPAACNAHIAAATHAPALIANAAGAHRCSPRI